MPRMTQIRHLPFNRRTGAPRAGASRLLALGGLLGAVVASSCCILPLVLFSVGISGAWIVQLTALAPYQPLFVVFALTCLGIGFWRVYRPAVACDDDAICARPLPNRLVKGSLWVATALIVGAIAFDYLAPRFLTY